MRFEETVLIARLNLAFEIEVRRCQRVYDLVAIGGTALFVF